VLEALVANGVCEFVGMFKFKPLVTRSGFVFDQRIEEIYILLVRFKDRSRMINLINPYERITDSDKTSPHGHAHLQTKV
jgi:hypothetical protein